MAAPAYGDAMSRLVRLTVALALIVAASSGCGGDDDPSAGTASPSTVDSPTVDTPAGETSLPPVDGPFAPGRTQLPGFGEVRITVVDGPDGEPIILCVLLAETQPQRARGLMAVTDPDLGGYDGMLFVYPEDVEGGFWMRDTLLPLTVAYLSADGAVVDAVDMEPCPADAATCPTYPPSGPYRLALEVPQGGLAPLGLEVGGSGRVEVGGACPPG